MQYLDVGCRVPCHVRAEAREKLATSDCIVEVKALAMVDAWETRD